MHILDKKKNPVVLALGYFDSVHVGHREVIKRAREEADRLGCKLVVFSFDGNLRAMITGEEQKFVFTTKEREKLLLSLGADEIYFAPVNKEFLSLTKEEFLDKINGLFEVKAYVSGSDYRFGKGALGNTEYLKEYASQRGQTVIIAKDVFSGGEKVSTSRIKKLLANGKIKKANSLLSLPYSVMGKVVHDRGVGKSLGYPTANLTLKKDRQPLKNGVYAGRVVFDGKEYLAVINYGARPTFNENNPVIEAHIIGFSNDIYDKGITVVFDNYIRDIKAFSSKEELVEQLKKDILTVEKSI